MRLFLISLLFLANCLLRPNRIEMKEGIRGRVEIWEGDFMPPSRGKVYYEKRTIFVFQKANLKDCIPEEGRPTFYKEIRAHFVDSVVSDKDGYFSIALLPGEYSLFVREEGSFYANLFDGEGFVFPVKVEKGKMSEVNIRIDYKATY